MTDPARGEYRLAVVERVWGEQRIEADEQEIWRRPF
jgi:hypothetical protein